MAKWTLIRGIRAADREESHCLLEAIFSFQSCSWFAATDSGSWRWADGIDKLRSFKTPNVDVYNLLRPVPQSVDYLNNNWGVTRSEEEWKTIWKSLWCADSPLRAKVFIWRVIQSGLFSSAHASKIGLSYSVMGTTGCVHVRKRLDTFSSLVHMHTAVGFFALQDPATCWRTSRWD